MYILTKDCTFYVYDYCKTNSLLYVLTALAQGFLKMATASKHAVATK